MSYPREGEAYIHGQSQQQARELLEAADRLGIDPHLIRTTDGGFIAPAEVIDQTVASWSETDAVV